MLLIESEFEYKGYKCVTTFTDMGHRCGYVAIPEGHPLYGKQIDSQLKVTLAELCNDEEMGKVGKRGVWTLLGLPDNEDDQVNIGSYFSVHGSITYADGGKNSHHPIDSDYWWLGFDCGHYGDCPDYDLLEKLWGDNIMVQHRIQDRDIYEGCEVRTLGYVQQECKNLVSQIIKLVEQYY